MTPAPISVERLRELLDKATPGPWFVCNDNEGEPRPLWTVENQAYGTGGDDDAPLQLAVLYGGKEDAELVAAMHEALPALLHQLAELEEQADRFHARAEAYRKDSEAAESKLAEREAEVDLVRSGLRNRGEYIEGQPPLPLALVAYDHMRLRAEAAERAREESIQALRAADEWILNAPHGDNCFVSDHCEGDPGNRCNCGRESVLNYIMETRINHDAAFLAASGGA